MAMRPFLDRTSLYIIAYTVMSKVLAPPLIHPSDPAVVRVVVPTTASPFSVVK